MPVRKIIPTYNSLTGRLTGWKSGPEIRFESSLERDFAYLLQFDSLVESFDVQPLRIHFKDDKGDQRSYVPDFLVRYKGSGAKNKKPRLIEVKYREDLKKNWIKLKPKFVAANAYANKKNWVFKIITEREIRNERLDNVKFLARYQNSMHNLQMEHDLLTELQFMETSTPEELVDSLSYNPVERGQYLFVLWHMITRNIIQTDLNEKLTMTSLIWPKP